MVMEKLTSRRNWLGASEIAAAAGLSDYASPYTLWRRYFQLEEFPETPQQAEGLALEPLIRKAYEDKFGVEVKQIEPLMHPEYEFLGASPDGLRADNLANVELKTVGFRTNSKWGEEGTDEVPMDYLCQGHFQAGVLRANGIMVEEVHFVKWYRDQGASFYKAVYDEDLFRMLVAAGVAFHNDFILTQTPPPVDGSEAAARALKEKFPFHVEGKLIVADSICDEKAARLIELKAQGKVLDEEQKALENWIKEYIGDAEMLDTQLGRFTYKLNAGSAGYTVDPKPPTRVFRTPSGGKK